MKTDTYYPVNLTKSEINTILNGMELLIMQSKELDLSENAINCYEHINKLFEGIV